MTRPECSWCGHPAHDDACPRQINETPTKGGPKPSPCPCTAHLRQGG